jgi:prolyl 4-hydroxylase
MHLIKENINNGPVPVLLTKNTHPSFIGSWILDDLSICDRLIDYVEDKKAKKRGEVNRGVVGHQDSGKIGIDKKTKDSFERSLSFEHKVCCDYSIELQKCLNLYLKDYPFADKVAAFNDGVEQGNVQKYPKGGGFFKFHTERASLLYANRHLVYMTYLNDVTEGGETEFAHQKLKVKPQKGLTLIWPCDWTHYHRGIPSQTQVKYITTGWYCYS